MGAGLAVSVVLSPFDVASTRLYNQPVRDGHGALYRGLPNAIVKIVRVEGIGGLYKGTPAMQSSTLVTVHTGFGALYCRIAPHTLLLFVFWEAFRKQIEGVL